MSVHDQPPARSDPARAVPPPDLRDTITPDAFRLAPELLGTPLAPPWRRGAAMALDGLLIGILSSASGMLFGLAAAVVLFRVSGRPAPGGYIRRSVRLVLRFWAAIILFVVVLRGWDAVGDRFEDRGERDPAASASAPPLGPSPASVSGVEGLRTAATLLSLSNAGTEAEARARADDLVPALRADGVPEADIRQIFQEMAHIPGKSWMTAVADSVMGPEEEGVAEPAELGSESSEAAVLAYADALEEGDTAAARALRSAAATAVAADTIAALRDENSAMERRRREAAERAERLQEELDEGPGIMSMLRALADDLGLGLGWAGLYFTTFVTLWKGQTPGKRVMRIRIIRLDGQQIGWWAAFERFGGYAAGLATGLLGFAQILWDRNRQAVQDKISGTVVIGEVTRAG